MRSLSPLELKQAQNYLARSIAEGRTTIARPLLPAEYDQLPDEPEEAPAARSFGDELLQFSQVHPEPFTSSEFVAWLREQGTPRPKQTVWSYFTMAQAAGCLQQVGRQRYGYKLKLYTVTINQTTKGLNNEKPNEV